MGADAAGESWGMDWGMQGCTGAAAWWTGAGTEGGRGRIGVDGRWGGWLVGWLQTTAMAAGCGPTHGDPAKRTYAASKDWGVRASLAQGPPFRRIAEVAHLVRPARLVGVCPVLVRPPLPLDASCTALRVGESPVRHSGLRPSPPRLRTVTSFLKSGAPPALSAGTPLSPPPAAPHTVPRELPPSRGYCVPAPPGTCGCPGGWKPPPARLRPGSSNILQPLAPLLAISPGGTHIETETWSPPCAGTDHTPQEGQGERGAIREDGGGRGALGRTAAVGFLAP